MKIQKVGYKQHLNGFTLVELLVVISIIAILAAVGATVYSGTQKNARESRRQADIGSIAAAFEANKGSNITYTALADASFAGGKIPTDTSTAKYCIKKGTTTTPPAAPSTVGEWPATQPSAPVGSNFLDTSICPDGWSIISATTQALAKGTSTTFGTTGTENGATAPSWIICARSENNTTVSADPLKVFCKQSSQ